eukprot:NODE_1255_length_1020_cov_317.072091_g872_i0.p1 GENE.NODE_1255_length_1020_cov_317.072091_g872_i0~~NODE_1255_length_1020_cov_317.072091_g872_i0.p1  ORF type:complete len:263 (-),score=61.24 NODE_1255_length_1020_cov_317.072091_g872_i0:232-948(-)
MRSPNGTDVACGCLLTVVLYPRSIFHCAFFQLLFGLPWLLLRGLASTTDFALTYSGIFLLLTVGRWVLWTVYVILSNLLWYTIGAPIYYLLYVLFYPFLVVFSFMWEEVWSYRFYPIWDLLTFPIYVIFWCIWTPIEFLIIWPLRIIVWLVFEPFVDFVLYPLWAVLCGVEGILIFVNEELFGGPAEEWSVIGWLGILALNALLLTGVVCLYRAVTSPSETHLGPNRRRYPRYLYDST